jgi:hypothetical protein
MELCLRCDALDAEHQLNAPTEQIISQVAMNAKLFTDRESAGHLLYSFGMCILEAVLTEYPWGRLLDPGVKYYVLQERRIPRRPVK